MVVGATRFAPHLEKCLSGNRRGAKKGAVVEQQQPQPKIKREWLEDGLPKKIKPKVEFVDPHPESCIIRVRLHHGSGRSRFLQNYDCINNHLLKLLDGMTMFVS